MTDEIRLRHVTPQDLDLFEHGFGGPEGTGEHQWFGYCAPHALRRRFAETGLLTPEGGVLSVAEVDETVGRIEWFAAAWGRPATSTCWTLAIGLLPEARGRGIGTEAQRLAAGYLFDHTRAQRIQAWTDVTNIAEQRALEKAGFQREGVIRSAQWRAGRWHDQFLYSLLRTEQPGGGGR